MNVAYACNCMCCVWEFLDEILLRGGECKTRENLNFSKKRKKTIIWRYSTS